MGLRQIGPDHDLFHLYGKDNVVLMRGHGFSAGAKSLIEVLRISIYLPANARILTTAMMLGGDVKDLSEGEVQHQIALDPLSPAIQRAWEYWARRAGCADMLVESP